MVSQKLDENGAAIPTHKISKSCLDAFPDAILLIHKSGHVVYANMAARRLFNAHRNDLEGMPFAQPSPTQTPAPITLLRNEGEPVQATLQAVPINEDGVELSLVTLHVPLRTEQQSGGGLPYSSYAPQDLFPYALEAAPVGIILVRADGDMPIIHINRHFTTMTGYSPEEVLGHNCRFLQGQDREQPAIGELRRAIAENRAYQGKIRNYRKDGTRFWNWLAVAPIFDRLGRCTHFVGFQQDITEAETQQERERLLSEVIQQSPSPIIMTDSNAQIMYVNRAFEQVSGYSAKEILGCNPRTLRSGQTPAHAYRDMRRTLSAGETWCGDLVNKTKDGRILYIRASIIPVADDTGKIAHYAAVEEDITLERQQAERIERQAYFDVLTDLPNWQLAKDRLEQMLHNAANHASMVALLFIDIDDFKFANDTLGHESGDIIILETTRRLQALMRGDETLARLGGDEFLILLPALTKAGEAGFRAEQILDAFKPPFELDQRTLNITASIGIAIYPQDATTTQDLLKSSDLAMYGAKKAGHNTYCFFTEDMNNAIVRQLSVREQLNGALGKSEFGIFFQPVIKLAERRIVGAEALIRWQNPILGTVGPDEFIPAAEEMRHICALGRYVMKEALAWAAAWRATFDPDFVVAVNISPQQIQEDSFLPSVRNALAAAGLPGHALELEVTETALMATTETVTSTLEALRAFGVRLSLDDFGTGYASLAYLREHAFDTLKIDKSFVQDTTDNEKARELVTASLGLAKALKMNVVAEGVETAEQAQFLVEKGARHAQGFLFGRPMPPEALATELGQPVTFG